jgi:hypothetical protein
LTHRLPNKMNKMLKDSIFRYAFLLADKNVSKARSASRLAKFKCGICTLWSISFCMILRRTVTAIEQQPEGQSTLKIRMTSFRSPTKIAYHVSLCCCSSSSSSSFSLSKRELAFASAKNPLTADVVPFKSGVSADVKTIR